MNRRAQSVITVFFWVVIFIILWALFLGSWVNDSAEAAITNNGLTGIEALFLSNLNLIIFLVLLIAILAYSAFGANT